MEHKHTRLGIASFVLSVLTAMCTFGLFALALILNAANHGQFHPGPVGKVILFLFLFGLFFTNLAAIALGIAGLLQAECKKVFAVLGTGIASFQVAATVLLIIIEAVDG